MKRTRRVFGFLGLQRSTMGFAVFGRDIPAPDPAQSHE
jgi:hypothetical protein